MKKIVEEVTDPSTQISLAEAQQLYGDEAEVDMEIEFPRPTEDLGRIAAQTAKQVIFQKVREAERDNVYAEYSEARRRSGERRGEAVRERRHHHGARPHRGAAARARNSRARRTTPSATASAP